MLRDSNKTPAIVFEGAPFEHQSNSKHCRILIENPVAEESAHTQMQSLILLESLTEMRERAERHFSTMEVLN